MNTISYFEIQSDNPEKTIWFYTTVFGWKFVKDPNIPIEYWRIEGAGIYGGLFKRPLPIPQTPSGANAFVCSIEVEDFDTTQALILKNGGIISLEKFAVVGKCWQGYFQDPDGNTIGLFQVDSLAK